MESVIEQIRAMVTSLIDGSEVFLVELNIQPTNNIKVYLDADNGITIETIANLNKALYKQIDESDLFPEGDFSLEVSSAGLDAPLKLFRQYHKNIGRKVNVTLQDDKTMEGVLREVTEDYIILETPKEKSKEAQEFKIPVFNIKKTIVQVAFK